MKKYAQIIDNKTKLCNVGVGTNTDFYKSIGMELLDVEQAYNGQWYLEGYAPSKPQEIDLEHTQTKLNTLNQQLSELKENYVSAILSGNDDVALQIKTQYQTLLNGE